MRIKGIVFGFKYSKRYLTEDIGPTNMMVWTTIKAFTSFT